jgi:hypothetical protein
MLWPAVNIAVAAPPKVSLSFPSALDGVHSRLHHIFNRTVWRAREVERLFDWNPVPWHNLGEDDEGADAPFPYLPRISNAGVPCPPRA